MLAIVWLGDLVLADDSSVKSAATIDRTTLDSSWLSDVRHPITGLLSRGVRPEEGVGYFAILNHARELSPTELKDAAKRFERERLAVVKDDPNYRFYFRKSDEEFPTFVDLFRAPERYHGQPVTFHGHVRRIISFAAGVPNAETFPSEALAKAATEVLTTLPMRALQYDVTAGYLPLRERIAAPVELADHGCLATHDRCPVGCCPPPPRR